jgi:hypothetical protein
VREVSSASVRVGTEWKRDCGMIGLDPTRSSTHFVAVMEKVFLGQSVTSPRSREGK